MKNLSLKQYKMIIKGTRQEILKLKKERDKQELYCNRVQLIEKIWMKKQVMKSLKKDMATLTPLAS